MSSMWPTEVKEPILGSRQTTLCYFPAGCLEIKSSVFQSHHLGARMALRYSVGSEEHIKFRCRSHTPLPHGTLIDTDFSVKINCISSIFLSHSPWRLLGILAVLPFIGLSMYF